MNRAAMYPNKLCYQREVDKNKRIHAQRLKNMKATNRTNSASLMDNRPPRRFKHLQLNLKKRQLEEERYFRIERENKLLMQKMFAIMKQKPDPRASEYLPGLRINSSQMPMVDNYLSTQTNLPGKAVLIPSLNREARRRSYDRIMTENVQILARITNKKANYSVRKWEMERSQTETYLSNIQQDLTAGYLKQGAHGRSVFFDPSVTSPSRLRPLSQQSSRRKRRGGTRGSKSKTWTRGRSRKAKQPLTSPIRGSPGGRAMTAPGGNEARGLGDETGCLLVECTRSLNDERGTHATLRVVEVPTLGGTAAGDVELATSGVRVLADVSSGGGASLQLTVDDLKEFAASSRDAAGLMSALQALRMLDQRQNYTRISTVFNAKQLGALGRAVLRRVEVVPQPFGGYVVTPNDVETDHGEGGEPLPPPPPPFSQDDAGTGPATPATQDDAAPVDIPDDDEAARAATKLQSIQRGRLARERVAKIREEQAPE